MSQESLPQIELGAMHEGSKVASFYWRNNPTIYRWCRQYEPVTREHHDAYWARVACDPNTKMYAVYNRSSVVGICGLTSIDWINRRAEFSLYIGPEYQDRGYHEAALRALCLHGFNVLNLNCIWGESFEENPAIKVFKRVGFKEEGRRRQFYFREGKYIDATLFSLLRDEYVDSDSDTSAEHSDSHNFIHLIDNLAGGTRATG